MTRNLFDLQDQIAVVTGGLGQLGKQFTLALVDYGARVAVLDRSNDKKLVAQRFGPQAENRRLKFLAADVTNRSSLEDALKEIENAWGSPSILINNAGLDSPPNAPASDNGPFESFSEESWSAVLDVNLTGVFFFCYVFGGAMSRAKRGSIINISSIYGLVSPDQRLYEYRQTEGAPFYKPISYSVSKSGLLNLTRYLATYWAQSSVRVNTLTLGGVFNSQDQTFLANYCYKVPLGRMANEDDYNGAVIFLASNASAYMTGSNLIIDGGWTAW